MRIIAATVFVCFLHACGTTHKINHFQYQACIDVYCNATEDNVVKYAGLRAVEIAASVYKVDVNLDRGICNNRYLNRDIDYRYAFKSAADICHERSIKQDGN